MNNQIVFCFFYAMLAMSDSDDQPASYETKGEHDESLSYIWARSSPYLSNFWTCTSEIYPREN
jgi:hypothetical protein